jgi:hypothetical protein
MFATDVSQTGGKNMFQCQVVLEKHLPKSKSVNTSVHLKVTSNEIRA